MAVTRHIARFARTADGTIGRMGHLCTLEEEDQGNRQTISSIPVGEYTCRRIISPTFGETFEVTGVPGRSSILFHPGNTEEDTQGCILVGKSFGAMMREDEDTGERKPKLALLYSRAGFGEFMAALEGVEVFTLVITDV